MALSVLLYKLRIECCCVTAGVMAVSVFAMIFKASMVEGFIDYAQLVKLYGTSERDGKIDNRIQYIGADRTVISGNPDVNHISTSMVERQNLTMRMCMRRFTRKTNAFSKKLENHNYVHAIY